MRIRIIFRLSFLKMSDGRRTGTELPLPGTLVAFPEPLAEAKAIVPEEPSESSAATWVVDRPDVRWECSRALLEGLASTAMAGFAKSALGGPELGGVLYGTRTGNRVQVSASRPVACEHQHGPAFTLSEHDQAGLEKLLRDTAEDEGLVPIGWYHTAYQDLRLARGSTALHNRWFPEPWQMLMVLRRERRGPVRVGLFHRDPNDALAIDAQHLTTVDTPGQRGPALGRTSPEIPLEVNGAAENKAGLAVLLDGIRERSGVMLVACPAGGELRLLADLRCALKEKSLALALLEDAPTTRDQFYRQFSEALHLRRFGKSTEARMAAVLGFLWAQARAGRATLLVLNHAEQMSQEVVEEIGALNGLRGSDGRLLQTILCCSRTDDVETLRERLTDWQPTERNLGVEPKRAAI